MCAPRHRLRLGLVRFAPLVFAAFSVGCDSRPMRDEDALVLLPRTTLAPGSLVALTSGATGAAYAIWSANDGTVHVARYGGSGFSASQPLGLANGQNSRLAAVPTGDRGGIFAWTSGGEVQVVAAR